MWWEIESSSDLVAKMEEQLLKDKQGNIIHNTDGTVQNNMIGSLTSMIVEHWHGSEAEMDDKHEVILMNLK